VCPGAFTIAQPGHSTPNGRRLTAPVFLK
jgi:hypothetical protein